MPRAAMPCALRRTRARFYCESVDSHAGVLTRESAGRRGARQGPTATTSGSTRMHLRRRIVVAFSLSVLLAGPAVAQVMGVRGVTPDAAAPSATSLKAAQLDFEGYRRDHLATMSAGRGINGSCDEQVGRFCYWYDDRSPAPPPEPDVIKTARDRLIARLDSNARAFPAERWTSGQLVRYLAEAERYDEAVAAAERCTADGWWCFGLRGFALHMAGRYLQADSAFAQALAMLPERERCDWRDLKLLLDDELLKDYRAFNCSSSARFEDRVWWLSRPMFSSPGNDARTEYYARVMYTKFLEDGPSVHAFEFDDDERELLLRYGWPRTWTREGSLVGPLGARGSITGHEPTPAHPMLPTAASVRNPALSDSLGWRGKGLPGVRARYHADYARRLLNLPHQAALFRRGDSAHVLLAYDVGNDTAFVSAMKSQHLTAALVLTRGEERDAKIVRLGHPQTTGVMIATAPWGPTLLSAEVAAPDAHVLSRARYGLRASDVPGSRVQVSDLLLFDPYKDMPARLEDVAPHMRSSVSLKANSKVGIYWETYNTRPTGEGMQVSITVAPEEQEGGNWLRRGLTALRLVREAKPISVGMQDVSARGLGYSPRSVVVDLATLKPGRYVLELEVAAEGTIPVRVSRTINIVR